MRIFISFIAAILIVSGLSFVFKIQIQNLLLYNSANADQILKETINIKKDVDKKSDEVLKFIDVPKKNKDIEDDSVYNDVLSRQSEPFGDEAGRHVNVHETAHGIHSDLRNEYQRKLGYKCNAFYCLKGKAVILKDPNITIRDIAKYIPKNLRSYRYNLYFITQLKDWDDVPTYVLDEWNAYILGSECAVEDYQRRIEIPRSDAVSGCLDFSIYAIAMSMAVKELDPEYWQEHPEFKEFIKYNLKRADMAFYLGKDVFKSSNQEKLLDAFLNDKQSDNLRNFMKKELGEYFVKTTLHGDWGNRQEKRMLSEEVD